MVGGSDRRTFLKHGAASAAALWVATGCHPPDRSGVEGTRQLDGGLLRGMGEVVLPTDLGAAGRERVIVGFEGWLDGFEPVPELMHGYGSQEIRYGPGDPGPRWSSQLMALDIEAHKRWSTGFAELDPRRRADLVRRHVAESGPPRITPTARAEHVAAALLSYWVSTPDATNVCYGRLINPGTCRPLDASRDEPARAGQEG